MSDDRRQYSCKKKSKVLQRMPSQLRALALQSSSRLLKMQPPEAAACRKCCSRRAQWHYGQTVVVGNCPPAEDDGITSNTPCSDHFAPGEGGCITRSPPNATSLTYEISGRAASGLATRVHCFAPNLSPLTPGVAHLKERPEKYLTPQRGNRNLKL